MEPIRRNTNPIQIPLTGNSAPGSPLPAPKMTPHSNASLKGRVQPANPSPIRLMPHYGDDWENPTDEPTHHTFVAHTDYLKSIFGTEPVKMVPLAKGSFWQTWTCPDFPHLVVKTIAPLANRENLKHELNGIKKFTPNACFSYCPLVNAANLENILNETAHTKFIVQMKADPIDLKTHPEHLAAVRDFLAQTAAGEIPLQDALRNNCGLYNGQLVQFDVCMQGGIGEDNTIELKEHYLSWSNGSFDSATRDWKGYDKELLSQLMEPLPEGSLRSALITYL